MLKNLKAQAISLLILVFGVHYKVRASALGLALIVSTTDYIMGGGKASLPMLMIVWGGAIKSFFTKSVDVTGAGSDATNVKVNGAT